MFYNDNKMKEIFTEKERLIIKEAIIDHRASNNHIPKSIYGKIVSSADRETNIETFFKRMEGWTLKYYPNADTEKKLYEAYIHMVDKYGIDGYAKSFIPDSDYLDFRCKITNYIDNKEEFAKTYIKINRL